MMNLQTMTTTCYADQINQQFNKSESHYIDLETRIDDALNDNWKKFLLSNAMRDFKNNHPSITRWSDFKFCQARTTPISNIDIDVTLQRLFDLGHACNILSRFKQILVMPISVYEDPANPGKYICWDGQHTAIVLTIIASRILQQDIDKCEIPIVVYSSNLKLDMRQCFIELNGDAKRPLDNIDLVHQKLFGVRTDGSTNPEWLLIDKKYRMLEEYKIFLTNEKFGDITKAGAQSRLEEFLDKRYQPIITEYFAKYFFAMCKSNRPVQPKESWMMYEFFAWCVASKIDVTDDYIYEVVHSLRKAFNGDFNAIKLYNKAKASYQEWYKLNKPNPDGSLLGIQYSEYKIGLTFVMAQIAKNFNGPMPGYIPLWTVPDADLFLDTHVLSDDSDLELMEDFTIDA
jgi:hypothetical protein